MHVFSVADEQHDDSVSSSIDLIDHAVISNSEPPVGCSHQTSTLLLWGIPQFLQLFHNSASERGIQPLKESCRPKMEKNIEAQVTSSSVISVPGFFLASLLRSWSIS